MVASHALLSLFRLQECSHLPGHRTNPCCLHFTHWSHSVVRSRPLFAGSLRYHVTCACTACIRFVLEYGGFCLGAVGVACVSGRIWVVLPLLARHRLK